MVSHGMPENNVLVKYLYVIRNYPTSIHIGKTSLADMLVASNGIISPRQAGKVSLMFL